MDQLINRPYYCFLNSLITISFKWLILVKLSSIMKQKENNKGH